MFIDKDKRRSRIAEAPHPDVLSIDAPSRLVGMNHKFRLERRTEERGGFIVRALPIPPLFTVLDYVVLTITIYSCCHYIHTL